MVGTVVDAAVHTSVYARSNVSLLKLWTAFVILEAKTRCPDEESSQQKD